MYELYINDYASAMSKLWSKTTSYSERSRLQVFLRVFPDTTKYKPYSLKTAYIRAEHYANWIVANRDPELGMGLLKQLQTTRPNLKGAYERRLPTATFEEAKRRIESIPDGPVKQVCLGILFGGYRISEIGNREAGKIRGKGNKLRPDYGRFAELPVVPQHQVRKALRLIGLKPHDLRKILATKLYREGMLAPDLMRVFGWNSIATAQSYLAPLDDEKLQKVMNELS